VQCQIVSWDAEFEGLGIGNWVGSTGGENMNDEWFIVKMFDLEE